MKENRLNIIKRFLRFRNKRDNRENLCGFRSKTKIVLCVNCYFTIYW